MIEFSIRKSAGLVRAVSLVAVLMAGATVLGPLRAGATPIGGREATPLDMVIAVDESGSLSKADVQNEVDAASTIAQSGLNPRSRVTVLGFGSDNGGGHQAVDEVCPPTVLSDTVDAQGIAECVRKLHRRGPKEGNDTDHVAALAQALHTFESGSPKGARKIVMMLTDGRLDVSHSPQYGSGDRNAAARRELDRQIAAARTAGVAIFPLGFGSQIDKPSLDRFAAGGSQQGCDNRSASRPRARLVRGSGDVHRALAEMYAASFCGEASPTTHGTLEPGGSVELEVPIPAIATDGVITVSKGDPRVHVDYIDPNGTTVPSSGTQNGSEFFRSGENSPTSTTEALRIKNPVTGTWKVKLTAQDGTAKKPISATAIWQGALHASLVMDPPTVGTGEQATVRLTLQTRAGAITDPASLKPLDFTVAVSGAAYGGRRSVPLHDDGKAPDATANDGQYAGTFTTPAKSGAVDLQGDVSGPGVRPEHVTVPIQVGSGPPPMLGHVRFQGGPSVTQGTDVPGQVTMKNGTGHPVRVRLALDGPPAARATVSPAAGFSIPPGESTRRIRVKFGKDAAIGGTSLTVRVADASDLSKVYADGQLAVSVTSPPGWFARYWWAVAAAVVLLLAVLAAELRRRTRRDPRGLRAELHQDGVRLGAPLKAPSQRAVGFRFAIDRGGESGPRLRHAVNGKDAYTAWRRRDGDIGVQGPGGTLRVKLGAPGEEIEDGLRLEFHDDRPPPRPDTRRPPDGPGRDGPPGGPPPPPEDNPWL